MKKNLTTFTCYHSKLSFGELKKILLRDFESFEDLKLYGTEQKNNQFIVSSTELSFSRIVNKTKILDINHLDATSDNNFPEYIARNFFPGYEAGDDYFDGITTDKPPMELSDDDFVYIHWRDSFPEHEQKK